MVECFCDWEVYFCHWCCFFLCFYLCLWCFCFIIYHLVLKIVYIVLMPLLCIKPELFNCIFYDSCVGDNYIIGLIYFCMFYFCFFKIYLLFELFILIILTSYSIPYHIYVYILVHMRLNHFPILSHILNWISSLY